MNRRLKMYRRVLWGIFMSGITVLCTYVFFFFYYKIPDEIRLNVREEQEFNWEIPVSASFMETSVFLNEAAQGTAVHVDMAEPFSVVGNSSGSYVMDCRLFGVIPLKNVSVDVVEKEFVIPGGTTIGVYLKTKGILAIGTSAVTSTDGMDYEPARNIIHSGDYIETINGVSLDDKKELVETVAASGGEAVVLGIRRNGERINLKLMPVEGADGTYRLGIWIRDNAQGIGTLTYIDEDGNFGALGHSINDVDTSTLMEIEGGSLYAARVLSVVKGEKGSPGEILGMISYENSRIRGEITENTRAGVYGVASGILISESGSDSMEVGRKQEIKKGPAFIRCSLGGEMREYEVNIEEIHLSGDDVNKGIVLKVTDEQLLKITGGIVQGMSGSPILQNGKLVGAVTHVCVFG